MIGGILVDLCLLAAVSLFGWAGGILGGVASLGRSVAAFGALTIAVLVCDPMGSAVGALTGASGEVARAIGICISGVAGWLAFRALYRWWLARRAARRFDPEEDQLPPDRLDGRGVAITAGAAFGMVWATLFLALVVLLPSNTPITRAAVSSHSGGLLIQQEGILRWLASRFPHYTQTLPKGKDGAVVGEIASLPMRGGGATSDVPLDADVVVRSINALRIQANVQAVAPNQRVATVAQRQARLLAQDQTLSVQVPGGGPLGTQVVAALGADAASFDDRPGIRAVWAHSPGNAIAGLVRDGSTDPMLVDPKWSEVGVGVEDAGWFNGRIYVLILIASAAPASTNPSTPTTG